MKFILMGLLRQFRKNYGREPSFDELRTLGNQAKEIEKLDRGQVIPFPQTRITDPFTPRPKEGELSVTIKGKRKELGLGNANLISLADIRETAIDNLRSIKNGNDPTLKKINLEKYPNFEEASLTVYEQNLPTWKNKKQM